MLGLGYFYKHQQYKLDYTIPPKPEGTLKCFNLQDLLEQPTFNGFPKKQSGRVFFLISRGNMLHRSG